MVMSLALAAALTLAESLQRAARQNPDLTAMRARLPIAEAGVTAARALPNPILSLSYGRDEPTLIGGIGMHLPFFGQRGPTIAAAQAEIPVTEAQIAQEAVAVHASVRRAYFSLALAQAHAALAAETAQLTRSLADLTQKKFEAGAAPLLDASQATLAARRAEQDQHTQEAALRAAAPTLDAVLGEPASAPVQAVDSLSSGLDVPPLESFLARIEQHPAIVSTQAERRAAEARAVRERAARVPAPDVTLEFSQLTQNGGLGIRGTAAFEAGVIYRNQGAIQLAESEALEAAAREAATRQRLTAAVRAAWLRLNASVERANFFSREQVPQAEKVLALARKSYEEGRTPLLNVLQAQADVNTARVQAVDAFGEAQLALADLEEATGVGF